MRTIPFTPPSVRAIAICIGALAFSAGAYAAGTVLNLRAHSSEVQGSSPAPATL